MNPSEQFLQELKALPSGGFIGVHIRRGGGGPSVLHTEYHGLAPADYYLNALNLLNNLGVNLPIYVFTDNPERAADTIDQFPQKPERIIGPKEMDSQAENLVLMSKASAFIGANSSYSWWAAYLGEAKDRKCIFPRPWYKHPGASDQDTLLPTWISVGFKKFI